MATTMWKRAIFLGGAVLLLAACDNVTAPTAPTQSLRKAGSAPSVRNNGEQPGSTTPGQTDCRTGYSISVGFAGDTTSASSCVTFR